MRNVWFSGKVAKDPSWQHAWTVQKNSRNFVMADQKTAKTAVKTEFESPNQKIRKVAEKVVWIARTVWEISHKRAKLIAETIEQKLQTTG